MGGVCGQNSGEYRNALLRRIATALRPWFQHFGRIMGGKRALSRLYAGQTRLLRVATGSDAENNDERELPEKPLTGTPPRQPGNSKKWHPH